jgi:hypothetical protein
MPGSPSAGAAGSFFFSPVAKSRDAGRQVAVYLSPAVHAFLQPWASGRQRSAKLCAVVDRYLELADQRPELSIKEWSIVTQLLGGFASIRDLSRLWGEIADRARDGDLPGVDTEVLIRKLRQLGSAQQIATLEAADQVAAAEGTIRERLAAAGLTGA